MRNFDYSNLKNMKWSSDILNYVAQIYQEKGKQSIFLNKAPEQFDRLVEIAKIQSAEASNAIEGIYTTNTRLKQIINEKTTPKNRDEEEIAGYRDALNVIHENFEYISITSNYILQLHKILYTQNTKKVIGGHFKSVQNYINATDSNGKSFTVFTPLAPYETPVAVDRICQEYNKALAYMDIDPLILIPIFIHDFLCIHPFLDGNGRMSRLLTTLLLYKSGFHIGKYISLENKIEKNKDLYYDALAASQIGWHRSEDDPEPFIKYFLSIVLAAYRDFENRVDLISDKLSATEKVKLTIQKFIGKFKKVDILEFCPTLSASSVEKSLNVLVENGEIIRYGNGKNTFYTRKN